MGSIGFTKLRLRSGLRTGAVLLAFGFVAAFASAAFGAPDYRSLDHEAQLVEKEVLAIGVDLAASGMLPAAPAGRPDEFDTLVRLAGGQRQGVADEALLALARAELDYGLHEDALALFNGLSERESGPARDRFRLALARIWVDRGDLDQAWEQLGRVSAASGSEEHAERTLLQARILMSRGRDGEAAAALEAVGSPPDWAAYARFNRAAALSRAGRNDAAAAVLESLGQTESTHPEILGLRDKADIALGFIHLARQQPGPAREAFNRVRFDSPFSAQALYGLGWSEFEQGNYPRALIPWNELQQRQSADPMVQEVWLMIPYAQWRLGGYREAVQRYRDTIAVLDQNLRQFGAVAADIDSGALLSADYRMSAYLPDLMADGRFIQALGTYRHLRDQQARLEIWAQRLREQGARSDLQSRISAVQPRLAQSLAGHQDFLDGLARSYLDAARQRAERYQVRAREELARLLDDIAVGVGQR